MGTSPVSACGQELYISYQEGLRLAKQHWRENLLPSIMPYCFVRIVWLAKLSVGIFTFDEYLTWSRRCRSVMGPLTVDILREGTSVVLDFAGNRIDERAWVKGLFEQAGSPHHLRFPDVSEDECLCRLLGRNANRPEGLYFATTTEEEFRSICKYFQAPHPDEGLLFTTYR
jgi:hypothetical protein